MSKKQKRFTHWFRGLLTGFRGLLTGFRGLLTGFTDVKVTRSVDEFLVLVQH